MMKAIFFCFALLWVSSLACEYGPPVCEGKRKNIKWTCPGGLKRQLRASWGRVDNKTCVDDVPYRYLQNVTCPGDDKKAADAVTEWCEAKVASDGQCEVRATPRKLRIGGQKYDPCRGTFKYLRVCTACQPPPQGYADIQVYSLPFDVGGITDTSNGDLAIVEYNGNRAAIISTEGEIIREFTVPGLDYMMDIARDSKKLYISAEEVNKIAVLYENGTFISHIVTRTYNDNFVNGFINRLSVQSNTIWAATAVGLYKVNFDANHKITVSMLLSKCSRVNAISVVPSHLVTVCDDNDIQYLFSNGSLMFHTIGEGKFYDLATDEIGQVYIVDISNERILHYSPTGKFIKNIASLQNGLMGNPSAIHFKNNKLFVATRIAKNGQIFRQLHVIELDME